MEGKHNYELSMLWTGNSGTGTSGYRDYQRSYTLSVNGKPELYGSSDPTFRGDKTKYNPEDLLLAALSACHMLSYLHVCVNAGIVVLEYSDAATGSMITTPNGAGHFTEVTLNPLVVITDASRSEEANALHKKARELCFIANSVNFEVKHNPVCHFRNNT